MHNFVPLYRLTNTMYNENENKKAYDKRREDVQRRTAAEGNRRVQQVDDGLQDDGDGGPTATDDSQCAVPETEGAQNPV